MLEGAGGAGPVVREVEDGEEGDVEAPVVQAQDLDESTLVRFFGQL